MSSTSQLLQWGDCKACSHRELESLVGLLNHMCKVVWLGRTFLRRIIDLSTRYQCTHTRSASTENFRHTWPVADVHSRLEWCLISCTTLAAIDDRDGIWMHLDGAWQDSRWFQIQWDNISRLLPIAVKELLPTVLEGEL